MSTKDQTLSAGDHPGDLGLEAKFLREVDPNNELPEAERRRRARSARRAYYQRLACVTHVTPDLTITPVTPATAVGSSWDHRELAAICA
jgi:hypothetical protein